MIYLLFFIYVVICLFILYKIIAQFEGHYDWFSGILYFIIFIISCSILYLLIFTPYHLLKG